MSKINEIFGQYVGGGESPDLTEALRDQRCPHIDKACYKGRKSDPDTSIGTCSLLFDNEPQPVLICPEPLAKEDALFSDCLDLLDFSRQDSEVYRIPEVTTRAGRIDYVLAAFQNGNLVIRCF